MKETPSLAQIGHSSTKETEKKISIKRVTDPESIDLKKFHEFLGTIFNPAELEPLESFKEELRRQDPDNCFLCLIAKDKNGNVISGAYGSLIKDILAVRLLATETKQQGTGVTKKIDESFLEEITKLGELNSVVGEAVDEAEAFFNRISLFESSNSARRLYYTDPNTSEPDFSKQIFYRLPPFEWNPDGTPVNDPHYVENLQVAIKGHKDKIPVIKLEEILRLWWQKWYIRPKEQFESNGAFQKHQDYVMGVLENEIIKPIKASRQEFVIPVAKKERLKRARQ
ncbi:hypothetical protein M0P48_05230 [Candidatus Gracilibacteria bacterium]|jgi:hypothetical protein|nr:hypothetical protein [Candidatus Gracilibacteria bacterium]